MAFAYLFIGCLLAIGVLWGTKYVLMPLEPEMTPNTTTTTTTTTTTVTIPDINANASEPDIITTSEGPAEASKWLF